MKIEKERIIDQLLGNCIDNTGIIYNEIEKKFQCGNRDLNLRDLTKSFISGNLYCFQTNDVDI